nr:MAG TPA: hypothetical protein [Caudoviricetes sp.]
MCDTDTYRSIKHMQSIASRQLQKNVGRKV